MHTLHLYEIFRDQLHTTRNQLELQQEFDCDRRKRLEFQREFDCGRRSGGDRRRTDDYTSLLRASCLIVKTLPNAS